MAHSHARESDITSYLLTDIAKAYDTAVMIFLWLWRVIARA
jgi:hypothetical protein